MEHFKDLSNPIMEQKRVLKDDGILIIGAPYAYTLYEIKKTIKSFFGKWKYGWERGFTLGYLNEIFNRSGMKIVSYYYDSHPRSYLPDILKGSWVNFIINGGIVTFAKKAEY